MDAVALSESSLSGPPQPSVLLRRQTQIAAAPPGLCHAPTSAESPNRHRLPQTSPGQRTRSTHFYGVGQFTSHESYAAIPLVWKVWEVFVMCLLRLPDYSKKLIGTLYSRANSFSSTKSTRRSPDSHLETKDCGS
jgi:hypothetical protein